MKRNNNQKKIPKDFFTQDIKEKKDADKPEDMIPFKWSKDISNIREETILYSAKNNN